MPISLNIVFMLYQLIVPPSKHWLDSSCFQWPVSRPEAEPEAAKPGQSLRLRVVSIRFVSLFILSWSVWQKWCYIASFHRHT